MALIKCSECGKEISDKAAACVNCGCPIALRRETPRINPSSVVQASRVFIVFNKNTLQILQQSNLNVVVGNQTYKVSPFSPFLIWLPIGTHFIQMSFPYFGSECGRAHTQINIAPNEEYTLTYKPPFTVFSGGTILVGKRIIPQIASNAAAHTSGTQPTNTSPPCVPHMHKSAKTWYGLTVPFLIMSSLLLLCTAFAAPIAQNLEEPLVFVIFAVSSAIFFVGTLLLHISITKIKNGKIANCTRIFAVALLGLSFVTVPLTTIALFSEWGNSRNQTEISSWASEPTDIGDLKYELNEYESEAAIDFYEG